MQRALALWLLMMLAGAAMAQPARPAGSGWSDPHGVPPRPAVSDVRPSRPGAAIDTLATVRRRGTLRVGVVPVAPMVMRDAQGEWTGYSIDLARRLAQDIGVAVEFVPSTWVDVMPDLLQRRFDLVATGLWVTVPRALVVNFSEPTLQEGVHLMASRARAATRRNLDDFNQPEVTVAVAAGTPQEALARRLLPKARLLPLPEGEADAVLDGRADAALLPTIAPQAVLAATGGQLVMPLERPLASTPAALAIRKGDADFLAFLNTWLSLARGEGWLDERALFWAADQR
jgi:polar amino acid transport system substrate-binding protein